MMTCYQILLHHFEKHFDEHGYASANWIAVKRQLCCASNLFTQSIFPSTAIQCPPSFNLAVHYGVLGSTLFYPFPPIVMFVSHSLLDLGLFHQFLYS